MPTYSHQDFMQHCCDLLAGLGPCVAQRMFGGWGISTEGLTVAIVADLGGGPVLWLKADEGTRATYQAAGCTRFTYLVKGMPKSMSYYSAPEEAMESAALMQPWAHIALGCALRARQLKPVKPRQRAVPKAPRGSSA